MKGQGGVRKNPFHGGGMDIFWNYTIRKTGWSEYSRSFISSWSYVQFEVVIVIYIPLFQVDQEKQQVTVQAGLTIQELNELLNDHGLALSK